MTILTEIPIKKMDIGFCVRFRKILHVRGESCTIKIKRKKVFGNNKVSFRKSAKLLKKILLDICQSICYTYFDNDRPGDSHEDRSLHVKE